MIRVRSRRGGVGLLLAFGALVTAGGLGYASIPGPDGMIHGCRHKQSGDLRVIDSGARCNGSTEVALDWPSEAPGPAAAYVDSNDYERLSATGETVLVSVSVPAGSYTISAKTHLYNASENQLMTCELRASGTVVDYNGLRLVVPANDQVVPFLGSATMAAAGTIELACDALGLSTAQSENSRLVATPVDELR